NPQPVEEPYTSARAMLVQIGSELAKDQARLIGTLVGKNSSATAKITAADIDAVYTAPREEVQKDLLELDKSHAARLAQKLTALELARQCYDSIRDALGKQWTADLRAASWSVSEINGELELGRNTVSERWQSKYDAAHRAGTTTPEETQVMNSWNQDR